MRCSPLIYSLLASVSSAYAADPNVPSDVEHVLVTADFRPTQLENSAASVSIIDQQQLQQLGGDHFEDILLTLPNFNYSGATSRPRYFQIRGVGEQEDYQGAPNSSVGFIIDDIDMSGLGSAGTLFDIDHVELLRGPQSTRFGANALAGAIYMKSAAPTEQLEYGTEMSAGNDDLWSAGAYVSGPLSETLTARLALQQHKQDGFFDNSYLHRDDPDRRDETTVRGKLRWTPSDTFTADATWFYANIDNGYDAWTLDNNGFTTLSDQPGYDTQRTSAASVHMNWQMNPALQLVSISSYANTHHRYAYDGDWANPEYWAAQSCPDYDDADGDGATDDVVPCQYSYWWDKTGHRRNVTQELRLQSTGEQGRIFAGHSDWLVGLYFSQLDEDTNLTSEYNGAPDEMSVSDYTARSQAVFAQLDTHFGPHWLLSTGVRVEYWDADYDDDHGEQFRPDETMWGGHVSLAYHFDAQQQIYVRVARGYKVGGFNMGLPASLAEKRLYGSETLYNYEIGGKWLTLDQRLSTHLTFFYMDRNDQQVDASLQDPNNPQRFILFTNNAASTRNYGAELESRYRVNDRWSLWGNASYLQTQYDDYQMPDGDGGYLDLDGRDLAHAPHYQFATGVRWQPVEHWQLSTYATGMDKFYYSDSNEFESHAYVLYNAKIGYQAENWSVFLWGKNLTDKRYGTRGFYFGNEPNLDWAAKQYVRYGDPRSFGLTFRYEHF